MTDIAALGLAVDSSQVTRANAELAKLSATSATAQKNAANLQTATGNLAKAHGGLSAQGQAAFHSIRSMTEQLALGVPTTQILTQQLNHLAFAMSGPGGLKGAFAEAAVALRSFITPTALVIGGVAALSGGALLALNSWKKFALQLDDTAHIAGVTSSEMAKLQAAASFKGISNDDFATAMGRFSKEVYQAVNGMGQLAEVFRANNVQVHGFTDAFEKAAELIKNASSDQQRLSLLQQMGLPPTMEWVRLLESGADGLKKAKSEATEFGGLFNDELVKRARDFDDAWNRAWTNFGLYSRGAVAIAIERTQTLIDKIDRFSDRLGEKLRELAGQKPSITIDLDTGKVVDNKPRISQTTASPIPLPIPRPSATIDPQVEREEIQKLQQRIGLLGQLASVTDMVTLKQKELRLAQIEGIKLTDQERDAILKNTEAQALGTQQLRLEAESYKIAAQSIGLSVGAATALRAEEERLAEFRVRGIQLTDKQREAIHREAQAVGEMATALERAKISSEIRFQAGTLFLSDQDVRIAQQLRGLYGDDIPKALASSEAAALRFIDDLRTIKDLTTDFFTGFAQDFRSELTRGTNALQAFQTALANAFGRLADRLIDQAIRDLVNKGFSNIVGSLGINIPGLGGSLAARGSSPLNPLFVTPVGGGLLGGIGGIGGGGGGVIGNITGNGGGITIGDVRKAIFGQPSSSGFNYAPNFLGGADFSYLGAPAAIGANGMTNITTAGGLTAAVNPMYADRFQGMVNWLQNQGYNINSIGGYNFRNIAGTNTLSQHAYGNAIDINPAQNPYWQWNGGQFQSDMPPGTSDAARSFGLKWGGDWRHPDPMHFEADKSIDFEGLNKSIKDTTGKISDMGTKIPDVTNKLSDSLTASTGEIQKFTASGIQPAGQSLTSFADTTVSKAATETASAATSTATMGISATTAATSLQTLSTSAATASSSLGSSGIAGPLTGITGFFAPGGLVGGYGGPTQDSNLIAASRGEYVVNASATQKYYPLLDAINNGRSPQLDMLNKGSRIDLPRNAFSGPGQYTPETPVNVNVKNVNAFDAAGFLSEALAGSVGDKIILNHVRANRNAYRAALKL